MQDPQVVGNQRQVVFERQRDLADGLRTPAKQIDDPQAKRFSESPQLFSAAFRI